MLPCPPHDPARVRDHGPVIKHEDGYLGCSAQARDLGTVGPAAQSLPQRKPVPPHDADLVLMPRLVQRPCGAATRMTDSSERLLLAAGVQDHDGELIGPAARSAQAAAA